MKKQDHNFRIYYISILSVVIGIVSGLIAYLLILLIALIGNLIFMGTISTDLALTQYSNVGLWVIIIPAIGGVIIGLMAKYGSPKIEGHGIPEAMEAVLTNKSRISPKVAILKPLSAAIAIGTGGPFGAEGPIIQTGGAFGSILGQLTSTSAAERKVLLAAGAAGGMAAVFNTPIAAVIISIELILFEFKSRSFIPLVISSVMATAVHFVLLGSGPLFEVSNIDFDVLRGIPFYILLGIICGGAAVFFKNAFYWVEDRLESIPVDNMWIPAIGGLGLGIIGYFFPVVLGVGYDTITNILNGNLGLQILLIIMVFKSLALMVSLGSKTSGGLLAPMFMAGAALGGVYAIIWNGIIPGLALAPGAYALVAMAAIFGTASRSTFALIIFAFEITQDYNSIIPLMLGCVIADAIGLLFMNNTIMTEKLERRGLKIQQDYEVDALYQLKIGEVMHLDVPTIPASMTLKDIAELIANHDPLVTSHQGHIVVDEDKKLKGVLTRSDIINNINRDDFETLTVLDVASTNLIVAYPDELVADATERMASNQIGRLPVVNRQDPQKIEGYLSRASIIEGRTQYFKDQLQKERQWFKGSASITG